jgi:hypothetical protein
VTSPNGAPARSETSCSSSPPPKAATNWRALLGDQVGKPRGGDFGTRILGFLARHFGSVFVLGLAQRAEGRSACDADVDAAAQMAAVRAHPRESRAWPGRPGVPPAFG